MWEQKTGNNHEFMEIYLNQTTLWLCYDFYKFITNDAWDIGITNIVVRRNGARNEEMKKPTSTKIAHWLWDLHHENTIGNQSDPFYISHIAGYEPPIAR